MYNADVNSLSANREEEIGATPPNNTGMDSTAPHSEYTLASQADRKDVRCTSMDFPYSYSSYSVSSSMEDLSRPLMPPLETPSKVYQRRLCLCFAIMGGILTVLALAYLGVWLHNNFETSDVTTITTTTTTAPSSKKIHRKQILLWQWENAENLNYTNCEIIDGSTLSAEALQNHSTFDAVIFNASADYKAHPLPMPRLPQQYYIYALDRPLTPTFRQHHNVSELAQFFNLTLSYKLDSDIAWTTAKIHGWYGGVFAPRSNANWMRPVEDDRVVERDVLRSRFKTERLLGLTVLNAPCNDTRKKILENIANWMQVDIYGDCGRQSCAENCWRLPTFNNGTPYKFYFAFEEELCTDYVSRYFYKALNVNIVPVVLGGANYDNFAPPHSYIQAEDFKTTHALFDYLQYLHQNLEEYIKYFAWHKQYMVLYNPTPFEDVCTFLHKAEHKNENGIHLTDFALWWKSGTCYETREFYITNGTHY